MTVFPKGKHDDEADSTAQFLDWFKTPIPGWGILEYYRRCAQELEKQRKPPPLKTVWAIGSMEWLAEQQKVRRVARPLPPSLKPRQISSKTTGRLSSPSGWDREFESPFLQQTVRLSRSHFRESRTRAFPTGVRGSLDDGVSRDAAGFPLRANRRQCLCRAIFPQAGAAS
jgi:hypothetical protein